jgi:mono/diheme cytochrome c family protein
MLAALACALLIGSPVSQAQTQTRGELLYATHCIACHTTQMHWRDKKLASDWASLEAQVRRWQGEALLHWSEDDIIAVTRHLNQGIYRFPDVRRPGRRRTTRAGANTAMPRQRLR